MKNLKIYDDDNEGSRGGDDGKSLSVDTNSNTDVEIDKTIDMELKNRINS